MRLLSKYSTSRLPVPVGSSTYISRVVHVTDGPQYQERLIAPDATNWSVRVHVFWKAVVSGGTSCWAGAAAAVFTTPDGIIVTRSIDAPA